MLAGKQTNDRCLCLNGPCVRQKAELSINTIVVKVWDHCLLTKLPASWTKKKNRITTVHKEGEGFFFFYNIVMRKPQAPLYSVLFLHCWVCSSSYMQDCGSTCLSGFLCSLWGEGFGCFSLLWVKPNSWGAHTFQALTLLELRPAACRQDVDKGRDVDSAGVLAGLKQSLKGHNSNMPVNTVLFNLFKWRIRDVLYFSYCQQLIPQVFCV